MQNSFYSKPNESGSNQNSFCSRSNESGSKSRLSLAMLSLFLARSCFLLGMLCSGNKFRGGEGAMVYVVSLFK